MSYSDEEKLNFCKRIFNEYVGSIEKWANFKTFLNGLSKAKIKAKFKNALEDSQIARDGRIVMQQQKKVEDADFETEIDIL